METGLKIRVLPREGGVDTGGTTTKAPLHFPNPLQTTDEQMGKSPLKPEALNF